MLPPAHRLRRSADFTTVLRQGRRARGRLVVVHQAPLPDRDGAPALVGLVVSRAVGISVERHRVSRLLRHQVRPQLDRLPAGSGTVLRALPAAGTADSASLARDIDAALTRLGR